MQTTTRWVWAALALGLAIALAGRSLADSDSRASQGPAAVLGPTGQAIVLPADPVEPPRVLVTHHDGSFENAYCFQMTGVAPPTFGALAEAFEARRDLLALEEAALWVTRSGEISPEPLDLYLWEGGVGSPPGNVIHLVTGLHLASVPLWPAVAENRLPLSLPLPEGDFTCGYWADFSSSTCGWFLAGDRNGPGGYPWVHLAPGLGVPTGWQHPDVVWPPPIRSFGIGLSVILVDTGVAEPEPPPPQVPVTWGAIRRLMR